MARTAVVAGVGPGLGAAVARRFVEEDVDVGLFARSPDYIGELESTLHGPGEAVAVPTDITDRDQVAEGFERVREALGPVDVLVNNASSASWDGLLDCDPDDFDHAFAVNGRGAFLCAREAVADMLDGDGGTVIFTGATSAVRGRDGAVAFSAAKFAARGLAESMARELGPEGIHVAHVVVDGGIANPRTIEADPDRDREELLEPEAIAETYWQLVGQDRSAWTLELDLRPYVEPF